MSGRTELTAERLREVLRYEPETGVFVWRVRAARRIHVGAVAGNISPSSGYRFIGVDCRLYGAHRLAWLYMTGEWPKHQVDHVNMDCADNRWANLRDATCSQNTANSCVRINNKSGFKGVSWDKRRRRTE